MARKAGEHPRSTSQLDPGADYTDAEVEFLSAMERYKRERRVRFPAFTEVMAVLLSLGYRKVAEAGPLPVPSSMARGRGSK